MFFPKYIKIKDVKARFIRDRVQLLRDVIKGFVLNIPFQNVTSFGVPDPGPKPVPGLKALLDAGVLRGHGGMCGHNNYSLKLLLDSIGYETYTVAAKFRRTLVEGTHVVLVVKIPPPFSNNPGNEDLYLTDVGCGVPLFEPILIQGLPFKGRAGGFDFAYERSQDGENVSRVHRGGDPFTGNKPMDYLCPQDYTIRLEPKPLAQILPQWGQVYAHPKTSLFHSAFYIYRYLNIEPDGSDFKIVCIRGKDLIFITRETRSVQSFSSYPKIVPLIHEFFPQLLAHEVEAAAANFSRIESSNNN